MQHSSVEKSDTRKEKVVELSRMHKVFPSFDIHTGCSNSWLPTLLIYQSDPMTGPVAVVPAFHPCSMIFLSSVAF